MPTVSKPYNVIITENKSHRTKAELKQRKKGEEATLTGTKIKERLEVKENPIAHKEFLRLVKLLKCIEKNDAIYEPVINRYCILQAECAEFVDKREHFHANLKELSNKYHNNNNGEISAIDYFKTQDSMQKQIIALDKQVQTKRKMLFDIEKENIMTIASALRSIPKKVEKKKDSLMDILNEN